jgi:DNA-binding MarR family transcriptional regulator
METTSGAGAERRRAQRAVRDALRELRVELVRLNHRVGSRAEIRDIDLDCFDLISRADGVSPSTLAKDAGIHPATLTGVLDRLESAGWIIRERDPSDRRAVVIRATRERVGEVVKLYAGMSEAMDDVTAGYSEAELAVIVDFLRHAADAGRKATEQLEEGTASA